jgi:hypothetical protein
LSFLNSGGVGLLAFTVSAFLVGRFKPFPGQSCGFAGGPFVDRAGFLSCGFVGAGFSGSGFLAFFPALSVVSSRSASPAVLLPVVFVALVGGAGFLVSAFLVSTFLVSAFLGPGFLGSGVLGPVFVGGVSTFFGETAALSAASRPILISLPAALANLFDIVMPWSSINRIAPGEWETLLAVSKTVPPPFGRSEVHHRCRRRG